MKFWLVYSFVLFSLMSFVVVYEIIEWWYVVFVGGEEGIVFLGL